MSWHLDRLAADGYLTRGSDSRWQLTEASAEFAGVVQVVPDSPFTTGAYDFDQAYPEVRRRLFGDECPLNDQ